MKKFFTAFLVVSALLCFALPAFAGPPVALPFDEALVALVGQDLGYSIQEATPVVASAQVSVPFFESIFEREASITNFLISIAIAATLAGLMSGAYFNHAQTMHVGRSRGIANGFRGGRRWV